MVWQDVSGGTRRLVTSLRSGTIARLAVGVRMAVAEIDSTQR
jgi:hypothetical protein